jgi:hypothetical protein
MVMKKEQNKIKIKEAIKITNHCLLASKKPEILCLSLTGSRAFGWSDEKLDYDIHGLFASKDYWDTVHFGNRYYDINLHELNYTFSRLPRFLSFEFFQNIANPVYIHPKFDLKTFLSFCLPSFCYDPFMDISKLDKYFLPRTVLHCYRIYLLQIYFMKYRKFELDIFKASEKLKYNFTILPILKKAYLEKPSGMGRELKPSEKKTIKKDFKKLAHDFDKLKEKYKDEKFDLEGFEKWKIKMSRTF